MDARGQANFIIQRIEGLIDEGRDLSEVAVLYRAHYQAMDLQMELTRRGIDYQITSGVRFFEQSHIRDFSAQLRFASNPADVSAFARFTCLLPKVGPKTAVRWLKEYGSLDQLVAQADGVPGKVGENLRASLDQLPLSHQLATVKCDVALEEQPDDLKIGTPDEDALRQLYAELEFKTWLADLGGLNEVDEGDGAATAQYEIVFDKKALSRWLKQLSKAPLFAFDTETTSLNAMRARIVGVSFAVKPGEGAYVPLAHDYLDAPLQLNREEVLEALRPLLEDPNQEKVGQNLKYDCTVLSNHGITLAGMRFDTMLESYVLDSTGSRHDMDTLALKYLGHKTISYEAVAGKGKGQLSFNEVPLEEAGPYAAEDAEVTLRLHRVLFERLQHEQARREVFERIEMPLVPVLSKIERTGVRVDCDMLAAQSAQLAKRTAELEVMAYEEAGAPFNIASPKQIQEILFERLELPVLAKTPKGQPSTAESVLAELAEQHELPRLILEHRGLSKLRSTYTNPSFYFNTQYNTSAFSLP
jgi:DNA polymerase-1